MTYILKFSQPFSLTLHILVNMIIFIVFLCIIIPVGIVLSPIIIIKTYKTSKEINKIHNEYFGDLIDKSEEKHE